MLSVREMEHRDIQAIADYWLHADEAHMLRMGVNLSKMPAREKWEQMLSQQLQQDYRNKAAYCMIWEQDGKAIGHNNVNKIDFGKEAFMHLHIWDETLRLKGSGTELVKMSLPYFFKNLELQDLYCEPNALNAAPNKTLERVGFHLVKEHITAPGYLNDEQPIKLWHLSRADFDKM